MFIFSKDNKDLSNTKKSIQTLYCSNLFLFFQGVPTLVLPDGQTIFQSMAIIEYLNQVQPEPYNLFPGNPLEKAQIRAFC